MQHSTENPGASPVAIHDHYDVSNDFFFLFLDDVARTYSCAMYEGDDDLVSAQLRKLDWHIEHANARGASRVLDVGCGWGGMLWRLSEHAGVESVVGLTLSEAQQKFNEQVCAENVEIRVESWADHHPAEAYDAIVSMGAFEHFARWGISQAEKIESYRQYFEKCHELIARNGHMTLQTMAYGYIPRGKTWADMFIADEIFRESDFPRLADIAEASEGLFEIEVVRNDRTHYTRTYREWFRNLRSREEEAIALVGETVFRRYEKYLRLMSYSFDIGALELLRLGFRRIDMPRA